jgi:hypothetical protein
VPMSNSDIVGVAAAAALVLAILALVAYRFAG